MGTKARDFSRSLGGTGGTGNVTLADLLPYLTTANVTELDNLYFSNDRVFANLQLASINDLFDVDTETFEANIGFGLLWNGTIWVPGPVTANLDLVTTDDIREGNVNLYYTNTRVRSAVGALNPTIIYDENTGLFAANIEAVAFSANTTDSIPEGFVNLYYRDSRVFSNLNLARLDALYDVSYVGNTPPPNSILLYNAVSGEWQPANLFLFSVPEADVANTVRSLNNFTSDDLREGNVNFFLNLGRFANLISNVSLNDLRDVDTTSNLVVGKVLGWDGNFWVPVEGGVGGGGGGGTGDFAERSNIANIALYAFLANVAEFAIFAARADVANNVDFANRAGSAMIADFANIALFAELANRANVAVFAETANSVISAQFAELANVANRVLTLDNFTTDNLREGNSLYYTDARVETNVRGMSITTLADVDTENRGLYDVLMWDGEKWTANSALSQVIDRNFVEYANVANTVLSLSNFTTDDLQEGTVNEYYSIDKLNADIQIAVTGKDFRFRDLYLTGNLDVVGSSVILDTDILDVFAPRLKLKSPIPDGVGIDWTNSNVQIVYNELVRGLQATGSNFIVGNLLPAVNGEFNIGSPTRKFRSAFFGATTVYLGNLRLREGPDGSLEIFNDLTGQAASTSLANVSATEFVTVNRLGSDNKEIRAFIGGNVQQYTSGTTGNLYLGVKGDGLLSKFSGVGIHRNIYDDANIQTDVVIYSGQEGKIESSPRVAVRGSGNIELRGEVFIDGNVTISGDTSLEISSLPLVANTEIVNVYSNTDVAVRFDNSTNIITVTKDGVYQATAILTLTDDWQDTPIKSQYIPTGTYIVQVIANDSAEGGGHVQEYYSGIMSWYSSDTNSGTADEISLHRAGRGPGSGTIFLRVQRTLTANSDDLKLQIAGSTVNTGTSSYNFKFRRLL